MLELLTKYAQSHNLVTEPGFKPKEIKWAIVIDSKTGFSGLEELGQPEQKNNRGRNFHKCPDLSQPELISGSTARSHFLVETPGVIALVEVDGQDVKANQKHQSFIALLAESGKVHSPLAIIADYLNDEAVIRKIQVSITENKVKPGDKITFRLDGQFPVESDYWHDWWREYRKALKGEPIKQDVADQMRSVLSGDLINPIKTHLKIEGLAGVGGLSMGDVLIGFDKDAFRSYGLEQSLNAAVSEEDMSAYRAALNDLIKNHSQKLAGTRVVHWFKEKIAKVDDPLEWLTEPPAMDELNAQHGATKLLGSIKMGERADLSENYYYALTLSGAGGRVMVRDWMEGQFESLTDNINQWFSDLKIVKKDGDAVAHYPKFLAVLGSTVRDLNDLAAPNSAKLWRVAIHNESIPSYFLFQSLARRKIEIIQDQILNSTGLGLIKAYHVRKYRKEGNSTLADILKPVLNEDFPNPAYQCGRLLAVLAELQRAALGDVGAGVIQRYYASASTTPALVLGRLTRTSQFHLNKLDPGLAYWYESKIAGIWNRLKETPPKTLSLEDQSLFALGYYQQLADMRTKKSDDLKRKEK